MMRVGNVLQPQFWLPFIADQGFQGQRITPPLDFIIVPSSRSPRRRFQIHLTHLSSILNHISCGGSHLIETMMSMYMVNCLPPPHSSKCIRPFRTHPQSPGAHCLMSLQHLCWHQENFEEIIMDYDPWQT